MYVLLTEAANMLFVWHMAYSLCHMHERRPRVPVPGTGIVAATGTRVHVRVYYLRVYEYTSTRAHVYAILKYCNIAIQHVCVHVRVPVLVPR